MTSDQQFPEPAMGRIVHVRYFNSGYAAKSMVLPAIVVSSFGYHIDAEAFGTCDAPAYLRDLVNIPHFTHAHLASPLADASYAVWGWPQESQALQAGPFSSDDLGLHYTGAVLADTDRSGYGVATSLLEVSA